MYHLYYYILIKQRALILKVNIKVQFISTQLISVAIDFAVTERIILYNKCKLILHIFISTSVLVVTVKYIKKNRLCYGFTIIYHILYIYSHTYYHHQVSRCSLSSSSLLSDV